MSCRNAARLHWRDIEPQLGGHQPGDVCGLDQVLEHVLPVRRPVAQAAEDRDQGRVEVGDADLGERVLRGAQAKLLDLGLAPLVDLLDPGGVDAAVLDQLGQGDPRRLTSYRVEAGQQHRLGRVVDHHVHPGDLLEGADVAAFSADDPALHLVAGQMNCGDDRLRRLLGGHPLDGVDHDRLSLDSASRVACRSMSRATRTAWRFASCSTAATSSALACSAVRPATRSSAASCSLSASASSDADA